MFHSLQSRVTAGFVAVIAATVIALGIGITVLFGQVLQDQYATTYKNNADGIDTVVQNSVLGVGLQALFQTGQLQQIAQNLSNSFDVRVRVYLLPWNTQVADASPRNVPPSRHLAVDSLPPYQYSLDDGGYVAGTLVVSDPLTDRRHVLQQFELTVVWIAVSACLLAFVIGGILSERLAAPFRVLTRATTRMGAGYLSERVPEGRHDEAGELARQFNRMAARLEESFATISADRDRLRQFVADVSHELRTPLTSLRTFNDLLQDGAGEDAATRRDFLGESARQIERLDWLTHNLLDLSRLDAGITRMAPRPADLAETLRRVLETNRPMASSRDVTLTLDAPPLIVAHDPQWLEQALNNIVGNAVKFSPRGGTVRVSVRIDGAQAVVEVRDDGPGIPPEEAPHIFERFYRGRDANRAGAGSGLGLAIAKAIVEAHHGDLTVESMPGRGTTMRMALPYVPAAVPEGVSAPAAP